MHYSSIFMLLIGLSAIISGQFGEIITEFDQYLAYVLQICGLLMVLLVIYLEFYKDRS